MISTFADREPPPADAPSLFLMTNSFETGGSERQFATLARSLDSRLFRLHVGCILKRGRFIDGLDEIAEFPVGGNLYGFGSMQSRWRLARYLREQKIAVVHAFDFYTNLLLIPAARMARVPVVIGSCRQLGDLLSPAKFRAELAALRWCDRVVCNSHAAAGRLREKGIPEAKLITIGNGLSPSAFVRLSSRDLHRNSSLLRVGMVARMNAESKNHRAFLRLAARSSHRFPNAEFILAGDGPLRPDLERYATDHGIRDRVRFLGDCDDTAAVFASLDVSVLPSASESLSNAILESMAAGVPVVATRVGGNSELVSGDRGILVALGDEEAMADAVERLLRDRELRDELGRNARSFAEANFTAANMCKRHEELYGELLASKTRRRHRERTPERAEAEVRPLRVAVVAASSRYVGGQSVQAELLIENWRNDSEVEATLIPIDPRLPRGLGWVERAPFLRTLVREPFYLAALWRGLKDTDVTHIFSASYWSFVLAPAPAYLVARLRGSKTVVHYHSGEARDHLRRFPMVRPILANVDKFVVPSGYLVDVFREFGLLAQPVPNLVDLTRFPFRMRRPLHPLLLCTRGFHPYYAVDVVVRAFAHVKKEFPEAQLVLVGSGPQEGEIRRLVEQLGLSGVHFPGVVSRQRIGQFYEAADIFVNASVLDNMPVSILEAFASGTPVVTTAPECMRYLVQHERTGMLSAPGDERGLARNVIRLLRDPELACLIASNALEDSKSYDWPIVRAQWLEIYRSVTNRSRSQTGSTRAEASGNSVVLNRNLVARTKSD